MKCQTYIKCLQKHIKNFNEIKCFCRNTNDLIVIKFYKIYYLKLE